MARKPDGRNRGEYQKVSELHRNETNVIGQLGLVFYVGASLEGIVSSTTKTDMPASESPIPTSPLHSPSSASSSAYKRVLVSYPLLRCSAFPLASLRSWWHENIAQEMSGHAR